MVNKKGIFFYGMVVLMLVVYLFKANDLILYFDQDDKVYVRNFSEFQSNSEAYVNLDSCEYLGGILEKAYFQGWAFCETEYDNKDKKIILVFKSVDSDKCYTVETRAQDRPDVYGAFHETRKIYGSLNGVECMFSTIKIKEGVYDYYVAVVENEYNYGIYNTNLQYEKSKDGFQLVEN